MTQPQPAPPDGQCRPRWRSLHEPGAGRRLHWFGPDFRYGRRAAGAATGAAADRLRAGAAERFRAAFDLATVGMMLLAPDGSFIRVNGAVCRLLGRSEEELLAQRLPDVMMPQAYADSEAALWAAADRGERSVVLEVGLLRPDGTAVEVQWATSIVRDDSGRVGYFFGQVTDVTSLHRAERQLRAVLDSANDAYISIDDAGLVCDWNPAAERMFGWSQPEIVGRELAQMLIPEELRGSHRAGLARYRQDRVARVIGQTLELTALHRDGSRFPIELTIWATEADAVTFHAFLRDVTERQRMVAELAEAEERWRGSPWTTRR